MSNRRTESKFRYFTFILYPDSLEEDWQDELEKLGIAIAISPLHDKDEMESKEKETMPEGMTFEENIAWAKNKENGTLGKYKKAHYHVMYINPNPVTPSSVRKKIQRCLGPKSCAMVKAVENVEWLYAYFTHESKDAIKKKKHVYDKADMVFLNNFDIARYITMDKEEKNELSNMVFKLIAEKGLMNILQLREYIIKHGSEHGLPDMETVHEVMKEKIGLMRAYFDAVFQEYHRNR